MGSPHSDDRGDDSGALYVFVHNGEIWEEEIKLTPSDSSLGSNFGHSVSIDGNTLIVGAFHDHSAGSNAGAAYVFRRDTVWTELVRLVASDGTDGDNFGVSVAVSGDYGVVGANGDDDNGFDSGSAYVFEKVQNEWTEVGKLVALDGSGGDMFGAAVSLQGNIAVIGAPGDADNGGSSGSSYVFERTDSGWIETAKLLPSDGNVGDYFGSAVSISGENILIGAFGDNNAAGSAYVFTRSGGIWLEDTKLVATDGLPDDEFGFGVDLEEDFAIIGAWMDGVDAYAQGSAYVFKRETETWREYIKLVASDGSAIDFFGHSVALTGDHIVVSAFNDGEFGSESGAAYSYRGVLSSPVPPIPTLVSPPDNAIDLPAPVRLMWRRVDEATSYHVQLSTDSTFQANVVLNDSTVRTAFAMSGMLESHTTYYWHVRARNFVGSSGWSERWQFVTGLMAGIGQDRGIPDEFILLQNYPNPFNPSTTIEYALPQRTRVRLEVLNVLGQRVAILLDGSQDAGSYAVRFDARRLTSGFYFYRLTTDEFVQTKRFLLLR
jgi:hypothetical protein